MRVVLVDDEHLPLTRLKTLLEKYDVFELSVVGVYMGAHEALSSIQSVQPDVVFLDIMMPDMDGLELGEKILELLPNVEVVFTSGFDKFAIDAFNLHAIDYLLKPVQKSRLEKTLTRLQRVYQKNQQVVEKQQMIQLLGDLHIIAADGTSQPMKWRTSKAKELFTYMLSRRNEMVYRETILELFWQDSDIDKASKQLYTAIYTIRQTLKKYGLDGVQISSLTLNSGYKMTVNNVVIDIEQWLAQIKALPLLEQSTLTEHIQAFEAYTGEYLGDSDYLWAEGEKVRLKHLWLHQAQKLQDFYVANGDYQAAIKVQERVQYVYPEEEDSYFTLMQLYAQTDNVLAVEAQYSELTRMLQEHYAVEPNKDVVNWYQRWKN
ncbi:response regulator [Lysinibacillus piscis]|uniref:Response regulatory domain-containing protein n=1 Tax=Lysinibacillus piscis TaxID=2518931 RepID=A0ABQ5NQ49_9BACI|nr:response regulator [Lysinibacillus sp. KH24]GLC90139.1 hypothetical protein LYSBPC_32660 [Lysinibacillus sp. KH24]